MKKQGVAWIGIIAGVGIGVVGAIVGIALPFVVKTDELPLSPETGRAMAWGVGVGMTAMFGVMCAVFGYLLSIRPSRGPRERSFAVVSTAWGSLLVAAFPWFLYGIRNSDPTLAWGIIGIYASLQFVKKWQVTQWRIRTEEAGSTE